MDEAGPSRSGTASRDGGPCGSAGPAAVSVSAAGPSAAGRPSPDQQLGPPAAPPADSSGTVGQLESEPTAKRKISDDADGAQEAKRKLSEADGGPPGTRAFSSGLAPDALGRGSWSGQSGGAAAAATGQPQPRRLHARLADFTSIGTSKTAEDVPAGGAAGWRSGLGSGDIPGLGSAPQDRPDEQQEPAGLQVQEIGSEQWEGLQRPPVLRPLSQPLCLVQEVDTDEASSDTASVRTPGTPGTPRTDPLAGLSIVEEETIHFAEEEHEELYWEQEADDAEQPTMESAHCTPVLMEGAAERALFSWLRPSRRVMGPLRPCLSPMPEETCEEMDWSDSVSSGSQQTDHVARATVHSQSPPVESCVRGATEKMGIESLPVESCVRRTEGKMYSGSLPVQSRKRSSEEKAYSESLPVESRFRSMEDKMRSRSPPLESRVRCAEEKVHSESLPVESRVRYTEEKVCNESLPVESRVRHTEEKVCSESLPAESRVRGSEEKMYSESLPAESRLRNTEEKVHSESLPVESRIRVSEGQMYSESLPVESRVRDTKEKVCSESIPVESRIRDSEEKVYSESLPVESRVRGTEEKMNSEPLPVGVRGSEKKAYSESLLVQPRIRGSEEKVYNESLPVGSRIRDSEEKVYSESLPVESRVRSTEERARCESLPVRSQLGQDNFSDLGKRSDVMSQEKVVDLEVPRLDNGLARTEISAERSSQNPAANDDSALSVEIVDRTDDKKYNFSALRTKRRQTQLAEKKRKEDLLKHSQERVVSSRVQHQTDSKETGRLRPSVPHSNCTETNDEPDIKEKQHLVETPEGSPETDQRTVTHSHSKTVPGTTEQKNNSDTETKKSTAPTQQGGKARVSFGGVEVRQFEDPVNSARQAPWGGALDSSLRPKRPEEILSELETEAGWKTVLPDQAPEHCEHTPALEKPSVVTPLRDVEWYVTETLILTVEVSGSPAPEARWVVKPFLHDQSPSSGYT